MGSSQLYAPKALQVAEYTHPNDLLREPQSSSQPTDGVFALHADEMSVDIRYRNEVYF